MTGHINKCILSSVDKYRLFFGLWFFFVDFVAVEPRYALFRMLPKEKYFESIKNKFHFPIIEYPYVPCLKEHSKTFL